MRQVTGGKAPRMSPCVLTSAGAGCRGWGKHDCSHQHDVGVRCNDNCVAILKAKKGEEKAYGNPKLD